MLLSSDDLLLRSQSELDKVRGTQISMIFQEPMTALDLVFAMVRSPRPHPDRR